MKIRLVSAAALASLLLAGSAFAADVKVSGIHNRDHCAELVEFCARRAGGIDERIRRKAG